MEEIINDKLYKKTKDEITNEDLEYYKKLLSKSQFEGISKLCSISALLLTYVFVLGSISLTAFNIFISLGLSVLVSAGFRGLVSLGGPYLKDLGLSREEWKNLKKSGRLKEISKMVDDYLESDRRELENLSSEENKLENELVQIRDKKRSLIQKMIKTNLSKTQASEEITKNNIDIKSEESSLEIGL